MEQEKKYNLIFNEKEQFIVKKVMNIIREQKNKDVIHSLNNINNTCNNMVLLAKILVNSPSISARQKECFFGRERNRYSLEQTLYKVYDYNTEFYLPIKVLIGKDFLLAKINFLNLSYTHWNF